MDSKENQGPSPNEILSKARKRKANTYEDVPEEPRKDRDQAVIGKKARTNNKLGALHILNGDGSSEVEKECNIELEELEVIEVTDYEEDVRGWCSKCLLQVEKKRE